MDNENGIVVSILCVTYNLENYITRAIKSFLNQKTNFKYEIIIGDDYSTDHTIDICKKFVSQYPNRIKLLTSSQNNGAYNNYIRTLKFCKGKYIAFCDGDDYWIDNKKLQKQVDFLNSNNDFGLVYTDFITINEHNRPIIDSFHEEYQRPHSITGYAAWELLKRNFISTQTVMVRSDLLFPLINEFYNEKKWYIKDRWFWLNVAFNKKIKYFDLKTAKYRRHTSGLTYSDFISKRKPYIEFDIIKKYLFSNKYIKLKNNERIIFAEKFFFLIRKTFISKNDKLIFLKMYLKNLPQIKYSFYFFYKYFIKENIKIIDHKIKNFING